MDPQITPQDVQLAESVTGLNLSICSIIEFSYALGNANADVFDIVRTAYVGYKTFGVLVTPDLFLPALTRFVRKQTMSRYTWRMLTSMPDYNLHLLKKRSWPYFDVDADDAKEWKRNAAGDNDYPAQLASDAGASSASKSRLPSIPYTNFSAHVATEPADYLNLDAEVRMLQMLDEMQLPTLEFCIRYMLDPKRCHIVKHPGFWSLVKPSSIVGYALYYSMYILRHEETTIFSKISRRHRSVFTHSEAIRLPRVQAIQLDPHMQQLSGRIHSSTAMPFYVRGSRRLTTAAEFSRRFDIITGGCLRGINLAELNAAVSGSILVPCAATSPLEELFHHEYWGVIPRQAERWGNTMSEQDKQFALFAEYYYPSHDSLIALEVPAAKARRSFLVEEKAPPIKNRGYNTISDIDISISVKSGDEFTDIAQTIFKKIQANCRMPIAMEKKETLSSFKYKIFGPGIMRPIDLFQIYYDPVRMTKKFHLPCVKMWFEGTAADHTRAAAADHTRAAAADHTRAAAAKNGGAVGLFMHRACVASLISGVNERYSWFSCNKIPAEVVLKYAMRGYSTLLNQREMDTLERFMATAPRWNWDCQIFGSISARHPVFADAERGTRFGLLPFELTHTTCDFPVPVNFNVPERNGVVLSVKNGTHVVPPNEEFIQAYINLEV